MAITYPLARYRFDFEILTPLRLPEYAGSTLRGAFGIALRQLACVTRAKTCEDCLLLHTCPYPSVFEPPKPPAASLSNIATVPVPYVIEPPDWGTRDYEPGEILSFGFILVGKAQAHLPLCIMAWRRAFARGVGTGGGIAQLLGVNWINGQNVGTLIHQPGNLLASHPHQIALPVEEAPKTITLQFETPLRLQHNGHPLPPVKLSARPLLTALARRASLLAEIHDGDPLFNATEFSAMAEAAGRVESLPNLTWQDWTRYSSRQRRTMRLGGCIGNWVLQGNLAPFWDIVRLGTWLHVGKEASFGLGKYKISVPSKT